MKICVTGAGGMLGRSVVTHLLDRGHEVVALVRSSRDIRFPHGSLRWMLGDVRDGSVLESAFCDCDYVIHLAARKADEADSYDINVNGTKNIVAFAERSRVKGIIHVSTISTKFHNKGIYGQTKADADEIVRSSVLPAVILKPSIIYSDLNTGIFGVLARYASLPVVPVFGSGAATYRPISADDVAKAIYAVLEKGFGGKTEFDLGGPDEVSLDDLIQLLSWEKRHRQARILHIPVSWGYFLANILSFVPVRPVTKSSVASMSEEAAVNINLFYDRYSFSATALEDGIRRASAATLSHNTESSSIMRYVCGTDAGEYFTHLYETALDHYGLSKHALSPLIYKNRHLLGALDAVTCFTRPRGVFRRKLLVASAIAECSPLTSDMLLSRKRTLMQVASSLLRNGLSAAFLLMLGIALMAVPGLHSKNA